MKKLLFINACVRPESRTYELAQEVLKYWDGETEEINLEQENLQPLNHETLEKRNDAVAKRDYSDDMFRCAKAFAEADAVLLAAPYWDLSFPASVKTFIEAITVTGLTFVYTPQGFPAGLCKAKKLIYVTTAGGSTQGMDFGYDYVKMMAQGFYGIPEVLCIRAENLDIVGADVEAIMTEAKKGIGETIWQAQVR